MQRVRGSFVKQQLVLGVCLDKDPVYVQHTDHVSESLLHSSSISNKLDNSHT